MLKFWAAGFMAVCQQLTQLEEIVVVRDPGWEREVLNGLKFIGTTCSQIKLKNYKIHARQLLHHMDSSDDVDLLVAVQSIRLAIHNEMDQMTFIKLDEDKADRLGVEFPFGKEIADRFPSAIHDVREATQCSVFERDTARVFHCMRAVEVVLPLLAKRLRVPKNKYAGKQWKNAIDAIQAKIKQESGKRATSSRKKWLEDASNAAVQFLYFKDAWRNHTMHGRVTYGREGADRVCRSTKDFLRAVLKLVDCPRVTVFSERASIQYALSSAASGIGSTPAGGTRRD